MTIIGDSVPENNKTFSVQLTSATNALGTPTSATGTIVSNPAPVLRSPASFGVTIPTSKPTAPHLYSLSTLCTNAVAGFPCVKSSSDPPSLFTWNLKTQTFASSQIQFLWGPATAPDGTVVPSGDFYFVLTTHTAPGPQTITYTATDGVATSNLVTLTINLK